MNSEKRLREASINRRDQEKQELRKLILDGAAELFLEQGHEGFSLRQVAERIGYSPATIYNYFENKDDLLSHVTDEGYLLFKKEFMAAANSAENPLERLLAVGRAYVSFGLEHPVYYQVIFMRPSDFLMRPRSGETLPRAMTFRVVQQAVQQAMEQGIMKPGNPETVGDALWAFMHGLVSLSITMPSIFDKEKVQNLQKVFDTFVFEGL